MSLKAQIAGYLKELNEKEYLCKFGKISIEQKWNVKLPQGDDNKKLTFGWMKEKGIFDKYATIHAGSFKTLVLAHQNEVLNRGGDIITEMIPGVEMPTCFEDIKIKKGKTNE